MLINHNIFYTTTSPFDNKLHSGGVAGKNETTAGKRNLGTDRFKPIRIFPYYADLSGIDKNQRVRRRVAYKNVHTCIACLWLLVTAEKYIPAIIIELVFYIFWNSSDIVLCGVSMVWYTPICTTSTYNFASVMLVAIVSPSNVAITMAYYQLLTTIRLIVFYLIHILFV